MSWFMIGKLATAAAIAGVAGSACSRESGARESASSPAAEVAAADEIRDDAVSPPEERAEPKRQPAAGGGERPFLDPFGDGGGSAPRGDPPSGPGMDAARERVRAALERTRRSPEASIEVHTRAGPGGTGIVRARFSDAYPGTGVAAVIYDPEGQLTYGKHGERDIAALFQRRGWLNDLLTDSDIIELVHQGQYGGVLILEGERVERRESGLRVILPSHTMRSRPRTTYVVDIPPEGDAIISER